MFLDARTATAPKRDRHYKAKCHWNNSQKMSTSWARFSLDSELLAGTQQHPAPNATHQGMALRPDQPRYSDFYKDKSIYKIPSNAA